MYRLFVLALICIQSNVALAEAPCTQHGCLVVGVVGPLTGAMAAAGQTLKNSMLLADEAGDRANTLRFVFEDDQFQPRQTVAAVQKLINVDRAGALVLFGSATCLAVADIAEKSRIPLICIAMSEKASYNRRFVFRFIVPQHTQAKVLAEEIRRRGYRSISLIHSLHEGMIAQYEALRTALTVPIASDVEIDPNELDLRTVAMKVSLKKPDAVFLGLLPPQLSIVSRQLRDAGYTGELFSGIQLQNLDEVQAAKGALSDAWLVAPDDTRGEAFYSTYSNRFKEYPVPDGAYGYDIAHMLIQAAKDPELASALAGFRDFEGIFGTYGIGPANTFQVPGVVKIATGTSFRRP